MNYHGKLIAHYNLNELLAIALHLDAAEARRAEASTHEKFDKMPFPPPNPEYLKLKSAIADEIRKKQNAEKV